MIPGQEFAAGIPRNLQIDLRSNYALGFWTSEALGMNWRLARRQSKHVSVNGALPSAESVEEATRAQQTRNDSGGAGKEGACYRPLEAGGF